MPERYAVIDIGTNSVRLLIADAARGEIKPLIKTLKTVRIGEGIGKSDKIKKEAMERAVLALLDYKKTAFNYRAKDIFIFATGAVREAANKNEFIFEVKQRLNIDVDVLSGNTEAVTGFLGAAGQNKKRGIIDIGGGSTEVICGINEDIKYVKSFELGTVRALALYPDAEIDGGKSYEDFRNVVRNKINELSYNDYLKRLKFIGIGGTATALASISLGLKEYNSDKVQGYILTLPRLNEIFEMLKSLTLEERKKITGLDSMRADVIVFGSVILSGFMNVIGINEIEVSDKDNMEGYLLKKIDKNRSAC